MKTTPGHPVMSSRAPRSLPRTPIRGPGAGSASTMPRDDAIFIPLCGLHKAMVIPVNAGIQPLYDSAGAGLNPPSPAPAVNAPIHATQPCHPESRGIWGGVPDHAEGPPHLQIYDLR